MGLYIRPAGKRPPAWTRGEGKHHVSDSTLLGHHPLMAGWDGTGQSGASLLKIINI